MKHRRHGRHAVKSTGGCMGMLAAAVAFGLLNMGTASAAPTPDAGTLQQDLQTKKEFDKQDVSLGNADIQVEQEQRPSLDLPDTLKVQVNDFKITGQDIYSEESLKSLLADKKGKLVTSRTCRTAPIHSRATSATGATLPHMPICQCRRSRTVSSSTP